MMFMLIRDDFTRKSCIYFLAYKSDAHISLKDFHSGVTRDGKDGIMRSDNGGEFKDRFAEICRQFNMKGVFTS